MAATINIDTYSDALVVLGTAGVVVPLVRWWGISPILGYLGAGALLGPVGLGSFVKSLPVLYWFTILNDQNVAGIAELGIVFLLFVIGLELSYERLMTMRRLVFGLGSLQVVATTAVIAGLALAAGFEGPVAIILGACLALSSTAVVIEVLSSQGRLATSAGRVSFAALLAQDLAVVPILLFISILGAGTGGSIMTSLVTALLHAGTALAAIVIFGRTLLRPLFRMVASVNSSELFIAAILFVIVGAGVVAAQAGLSMALGAFVAGLLLAETEYRKAVEATVEPFKGLLLGIFFFTVGMKIDVRELLRDPALLIACVVGLIAIKATVFLAAGWLFRVTWPASIEAGLLLGPGGEFAFVGLGMATALGLVSAPLASFTLAVVALTMALIPALSLAGRTITDRMKAAKPIASELLVQPAAQTKHAIVVGHGRVGKVVCSLLKEHNVPYIATDLDAPSVTEDRRRGLDVYYGDATQPAFLKTCGLMDASGIIITNRSQAGIDDIVRHVRELRSNIVIIARARDATHARHLYELGVTDAVPETIEASLQLSEAALVGLGVPTGPVIASIHEKRDEFRRDLQRAATKAGRGKSRSIRQKSDAV